MSCDRLQDGLRVLTAALRAAAGGRRAAAGMSAADTQTAGTGTRFPAGTHKQGFKNAHGAREKGFESRVAHGGRGGDGVQPEEVADVHFLEDAVELGGLVVQETQGRNWKTNTQKSLHFQSEMGYLQSVVLSHLV